MKLLTDHAHARMQQRGIRHEMLEALLDYGREVHVAGGRELVFFDKRARAPLARAGIAHDTEADLLCGGLTPNFGLSGCALTHRRYQVLALNGVEKWQSPIREDHEQDHHRRGRRADRLAEMRARVPAVPRHLPPGPKRRWIKPAMLST